MEKFHAENIIEFGYMNSWLYFWENKQAIRLCKNPKALLSHIFMQIPYLSDEKISTTGQKIH